MVLYKELYGFTKRKNKRRYRLPIIENYEVFLSTLPEISTENEKKKTEILNKSNHIFDNTLTHFNRITQFSELSNIKFIFESINQVLTGHSYHNQTFKDSKDFQNYYNAKNNFEDNYNRFLRLSNLN